LVGAIIGGSIGAIIIGFIANNVGLPLKNASNHSILIVSWGAMLYFGVGVGTEFVHSLNARKRTNLVTKLAVGSVSGAIAGGVGSELLSDTFSGGAILGGLFAFWITFGVHISELLSEKKTHKGFMLRIFIPVGTGSAFGATSGLLWAFLAKGAHAEGYVLLVIAMMAVIGITWAMGILFSMYIFDKSSATWIKTAITLILLVFTGLGIHTISSSIDLKKQSNPKQAKRVKEYADHVVPSSDYEKFSIVELIKKKKDLGLSELTALYILTKDKQYASKTKEILLKEARQEKFASPAHSVKSKQFDAAMRAWSYLQIKNVEGLFSSREKEEIIDWCKKIVKRVFSVEWVDYLYALAFWRKPTGPYENQEIGVGALSILAHMIEKKYPEVAKRCKEYIDTHAVVWRGNFRNTDDSIAYQSWWIYSAYLVAKYRPMPECLRNEHPRDSFEWLLKQWPPNGMKLGYNDFHPTNLADTMALGAWLFQDGRYKWLATKMLQDAEKERDVLPPYYLGLVNWDDTLKPTKPSIGSCYMMGPGKFPHAPGPSMPDKVVFREGWEEDSLYALLNLRYSGWHKYKASNCFVNIIYGRPFVVEDLISKKHEWLPAGRALYRDKKIDRVRLNGFQIGLEGYESLVHDLLKMGSPWAQDPPRFAEVVFFENAPAVDVTRTEISDWHGWKHSRVSALAKGAHSYLVVIDRARGKAERKVAFTWHLKGESNLEHNCIRLKQDTYKMDVFYPHKQDWYQVEIADSKESYPPAGSIHNPDIDLIMTSEDKSQVGFITLFLPVIDEVNSEVNCIDVVDLNGESAYPNAIGVNIKFCKESESIGARFEAGAYKYGILETNAELFVLKMKEDATEITYKNGTYLKLAIDNEPTKVILDCIELQEGKDWHVFRDNFKIILSKEKGHIEIRWANHVDRKVDSL